MKYNLNKKILLISLIAVGVVIAGCTNDNNDNVSNNSTLYTGQEFSGTYNTGNTINDINNGNTGNMMNTGSGVTSTGNMMGTGMMSGSQSTGNMQGSTAPATGMNVVIENFAFTPHTMRIKAGDSVTWINNDSVAHTATSLSGDFDSKNIEPGATYTVTFSDTGTYNYKCTPHPNMTGQIIVE